MIEYPIPKTSVKYTEFLLNSQCIHMTPTSPKQLKWIYSKTNFFVHLLWGTVTLLFIQWLAIVSEIFSELTLMSSHSYRILYSEWFNASFQCHNSNIYSINKVFIKTDCYSVFILI